MRWCRASITPGTWRRTRSHGHGVRTSIFSSGTFPAGARSRRRRAATSRSIAMRPCAACLRRWAPRSRAGCGRRLLLLSRHVRASHARPLRLRQSPRIRLNEIMKLDAFRAVLAAAEKLYRDGGNDAAAQALDFLARLVVGRGAMTVAAFATGLSGIPVSAASGTPAAVPTVAGLQATLRSMLEFCEAAGAKT